MKAKRIFSALLLTTFVTATAGCTSTTPTGSDSSDPSKEGQSQSQSTSSTASESKPADGKLTDKPVTLTYWVELDAGAAVSINSYAENKIYEELEKKTNVKIDFLHPTTGQVKEQFNLMVVSRDLPDLIEYSWMGYDGGPEKAISDGIIIKLNDLIDQNAPDAKALMQSSPVVAKQSVTDSGSFYAFMAVGESNGNTQSGPYLRADWLKDLNLEAPTTLAEWEVVLEKFKTEKGAVAPFTVDAKFFTNNDTICGAFGVGAQYYQKDSKVQYGPIQPEYKEYLKLMKSWYDKGLIDPDFASNDGKSVTANMTNGKSGFTVGFAGGGLGTQFKAMAGTDPNYDLLGIGYPKMQDGSDPLFHHRAWEVRTSGSLAITTVNKNPELSAQWANYFYTEAGGLLKNFGIEGESYTLIDGKPKTTDLIEKNPDGLSRQQALALWSRGAGPSPGPVIKLPDSTAQVEAANKVWNTFSNNATKVLIPPTTQTPEEAQEMATLITNITAYQEEMVIKFIMGREDLNNFDAYVDQLKKYSIDRVVELKQAALDRYSAR